MVTHVAWSEIENFYTVRKSLLRYPELLQPGGNTVTYRAKVKLHGTNAGVRIDADKTVTAFSRTSIVTPENDNAGFAKWVQSNRGAFADMAQYKKDVVIYGEWCGPGIQKGVVVNRLQDKVFAIFAVRFLNDDVDDVMEVEPFELEAFKQGVPGAYVLPWYADGETVSVNWDLSAEELQPVLDRINECVSEVERCDPWVEKTFGVKGTGEGLVYYPQRPHCGYKAFENLAFKAKGEQHKVIAGTKPVQADPIVAANAQSFAEMVVTPARFEQGVRAVNNGELVFDMKNVGRFLAWVSDDVTKETSVEREAAGLELRTAVKACCDKARSMYVVEAKKL